MRMMLIIIVVSTICSALASSEAFDQEVISKDMKRYLELREEGQDRQAAKLGLAILKTIREQGKDDDIEYIRTYIDLLDLEYGKRDENMMLLHACFDLLLKNLDAWREDEVANGKVLAYIRDNIDETYMIDVIRQAPYGSGLKRDILRTIADHGDLGVEEHTYKFMLFLPRRDEYPASDVIESLVDLWKRSEKAENQKLARTARSNICAHDDSFRYLMYIKRLDSKPAETAGEVLLAWLDKTPEERWKQRREWYADLHRRILACPDSETLEELDEELLAYYHEGERRWQTGRTTTDSVFARGTLWNDDKLFAGSISIFKTRMKNWEQAENWQELAVMLCKTKLSIDEFAETMIPELSKEKKRIRRDKYLLQLTKKALDNYVESTEMPVDPEQWTADQARAMAQLAMHHNQKRSESRSVAEYCGRIIAQAKQRLSDLGESTEIEPMKWEKITVMNGDRISLVWTPPEGLSDVELLEHQEAFFKRQNRLLAEREAAKNAETGDTMPGDDDVVAKEVEDEPAPERNPEQEEPQDDPEPSSLIEEGTDPPDSRDGNPGYVYWLAGGMCGLVVLIGGGYLAARKRRR